jgi:hypothetical protein
MKRSLWLATGIIIGVVGTTFLFAPSVTGARAGNFTAARASGFVWENGAFNAPDGASDFCSAVYQGTSDEVSILMTLPDGAEVDGAPIEDFFTMVESGELVAVESCFDADPTNDPQGNVLSLTDGKEALLSEYVPQYEFEPQVYTPGYVNGCGANWNEKTVEEMRPGWWQGEQDMFQANLEAAIEANEPGLSLEEGSTREWAPKVAVGPDVTTMTNIPVWMRNLIIPYCDYIPEVVAPQNPGVAPELTSEVSLFVAGETQAMYAWIETYAPGISLEEAAQRWVDGSAAGWVDTPIAPWGICMSDVLLPETLAAAGTELPQWISARIISRDDPGCN